MKEGVPVLTHPISLYIYGLQVELMHVRALANERTCVA